MNNETQIVFLQASSSIKKVQDITIGLFKPNFSTSWKLVIEKEKNNIICISIGELFGLHTLHTDIEQGKYIEFPDGKTLTYMMEDVMEFHQWCKSNHI